VSKLPVRSAEIDPTLYAAARFRLAGFPGVELELGDSRRFISSLNDRGLSRERTFFYLDAHHFASVPLRDEIAQIAGDWSEFVAMIDDFQVPGDDGYGFDSYGDVGSLSLPYVADCLSEHDLAAFFPSASSAEETGQKRGCVVICRRGEATDRLRKLSSLRESSSEDATAT